MRLIVVSNRLPVVMEKDERGQWQAGPSSGGLVTALAPVLKGRGGLWIGWPGTSEASAEALKRAMSDASSIAQIDFAPVSLTSGEIDTYYAGFSNEILWPLFHDMAGRCNFDPEYWSSYQAVNRKFAAKILQHLRPDDYVWIHDYHLLCVGQALREMGVKERIGFFLHIPFPSPDIFLQLPWGLDILKALLSCNLIGLQTMRDQRNFIQCVRKHMMEATVEGGGQILTLFLDNREVRVGALPIGIDYNDFATSAAGSLVADKSWYIHEQQPGRQMVLGIDRLDYTKGIPERLKAYRYALDAYPELCGKIILVQVVVPSRRNIPEYEALKDEIERLVGKINGEFGRFDWTPVHYFFRSLSREELLAYYRTSEIALITPIKDGMNLIAKEFCAASVDRNSVLILAESAGAADQLQHGALMVNPNDQKAIADAIYRAYKMPFAERSERMDRMRETIRQTDIHWWVNAFMKGAFAESIDYFHKVQDYRPQIDFS
ncbi:MAG: alpha,alpha-trehalose-phosphate synthase [Desulfatitalea sp. BRH_c12]|nr:MAG: alpha,alpha-trehalose-phosphate synthase [Desulfatitalea sp. BRH_c12]